MKSFFMMDNSNDHGKEAMLGYQISWLMRLAARKDVENRKLHEISRFTLLQLLDMKDCRDVDIVEVNVSREWHYIDVFAKCKVRRNNQIEEHLIIIENKIYTNLADGQLNKNSNTFHSYYPNFPVERTHFWLISCKEDSWEKQEQECATAESDWRLLWFYDVIGGKLDNPIGNDIFDEFWVNEWY